MDTSLISTLWLLFCAGEVALMQAGFLCIETGFTRSKNNINVAVKNVADFGVSAFSFWLVGYAIMFGQGDQIAFSLEGASHEGVFFFFQLMFCGAAVTIISGGAAERLSFQGYMMIALLVSAIIYPVFGHWAWFGLQQGEITGWLGQLGFTDFAGSTVVHSVGGWSCLALVLILGPRIGRFHADTGKPQKIIGANLPFAALGVFLLWVGWFGFNGGSLLRFDERVVGILINTALGGTAGMFGAIVMSSVYNGKVTAESFFNGPLAGLVSITASANAISPTNALIIGFVGSSIAYGIEQLLLRYQIDDAVGAIPVHLGAGVWGTLAVGIFSDLLILGTGLSRFEQIAVQFLGVFVGFLWAFGFSYVAFYLVNRLLKLRVPSDAEMVGLNVHEHDARTDILDMFLVMDQQAKTGDLSLRIPQEPFTEAGQIAQKYNEVMENLEQTVARVRAILETAQEGIITFSPESWQIQSANPAAAAILADRVERLQQQKLTTFIPQVIDTPQLLLPNGSHRNIQELTGHRADGTTFSMEVSVAKIQTKETLYYSLLFRDITERKNFIAELADARDAALQASHLKDQLLSMVGHELRTPLMSISGSAELIETGALGEINESQQEFISQIIKSSVHMNNLVNDLIEQSNLQSGRVKLNLRQFYIRDFFDEAFEKLKRPAAEKQLALTYHVDDSMPYEISNDSIRLQQIITNLVNNSIQFTHEGAVDVTVTAVSDTHWSLRVQDTGIGIPADKQQEIFEPFIQIESVISREQGGLGLGLTVVRQLVNLMQGEIILSSQLNQGTSIEIMLPFNPNK